MVLSNPLSEMGALSSTILPPIAARKLVDVEQLSVVRVAGASVLILSLIAVDYVVFLALIGLPVIGHFFSAKLAEVGERVSSSADTRRLGCRFDMIDAAASLRAAL